MPGRGVIWSPPLPIKSWRLSQARFVSIATKKARQWEANHSPGRAVGLGRATVSRQSLKASGSWNHHYQEQQHGTKGAESQGRGMKASGNKSKQARERAVRENHRSGGFWDVSGDEFHGQTRVEKANKCLLNKWVINGKAREQSQASGGWCLSGSSLCGSCDSHPRGAGACQHQPLMSMSQHRGLHRLKANDSSFVLGTEANIPNRFLWWNCSIW